MGENELAKKVLDVAFEIHKKLGPGLFESVYEKILSLEIEKTHGICIERQKILPVFWKNEKIDIGFRCDLIVGDKIIVELKSIEKLAPVHYKQLQTYLKITGLKLGLLINFNENLLRDGIRRIVNGLDDNCSY